MENPYNLTPILPLRFLAHNTSSFHPSSKTLTIETKNKKKVSLQIYWNNIHFNILWYYKNFNWVFLITKFKKTCTRQCQKTHMIFSSYYLTPHKNLNFKSSGDKHSTNLKMRFAWNVTDVRSLLFMKVTLIYEIMHYNMEK